jgi:hypothetical protein
MKLLAHLSASLCLLLIGSYAQAQIRPYIRFEGKGAAFSADTLDENSYIKPDGSEVRHPFTGKLFRDSQGRTRVQVDGRDADRNTTYIIIFDPVRQIQINLYPKKQVADVFKLSAGYGQPSHPLTWPASEDLGTKEIEGFAAAGIRTSGTGEHALVLEEWFSTDLRATLYATVTHPHGKSSYQVSNIRTGDPDPSVFQIPEGYTIRAHN